MATTKYLDYAGLQRYHGKLKTDVITPINNRIDEIVNVGGQPNVIEAVKINNNTFAIADKTASLDMNLTYDSLAKKIKLAIGSETQEIDATDFIKDGMLDNATYNAENKKLTLTFNTAAGKSAIDVDLTDLVDTYALSAGDATTGSYLKLTPGVSGTGSTSDPWKVTVALDETNLTNKLKEYVKRISTAESVRFAIAENKEGMVSQVPISGIGSDGLTPATTTTYEKLTTANTGSTFENVLQKFLANDIDLNTRLASVEGTVGGLGSAATKDETYFAKAVHEHDLGDVSTSDYIEFSPTQSSVSVTFNSKYIKTPIKNLFVQLLSNDKLLNTRLASVEGTVGGLGSAATKDESYFAKAAHEHTIMDVVTEGPLSVNSEQTTVETSVVGGAVIDKPFVQLLTNDSLLDGRLTTAETEIDTLTAQQVATIDMTAITGMSNVGSYKNAALTDEQKTTLQEALDKAISHGSAVVLSYQDGDNFILSNIHRNNAVGQYTGSFDQQYSSATGGNYLGYSFTFATDGALAIDECTNITAISNTEIDGLFV